MGNSEKLGLPPALDATPRKEEEPSTNGTGPAKDLSAYAPKPSDPPTAPAMSSTASSKEELHRRLSDLVKAAPVMLFMKGTPSIPECGFRRQLVSFLREKGVKYGFFNILADDEVRQGLKDFADWPTFPQLWTNGELVGGLDIVSFIPLNEICTILTTDPVNHIRSKTSSKRIQISSANFPSPRAVVQPCQRLKHSLSLLLRRDGMITQLVLSGCS